MFCGNCGERISDDSKFCPACGNVIDEIQEPQQPQIPVASKAAPAGAVPPKKKHKKAAWLISLSGLVVVAAVVLLFVFLPGNKEKLQLTNFAVDEPYLVSGVETEVTFTVTANMEVESITLYRDDKEVGEMRDNGKKGDAEAGDGIYTCVLDIEKEVSKLDSYQYSCSAEDVKSEELSVYIFPIPDEAEAYEAYEAYQELAADIQSAVDRYTDEFGNIPVEEQADALKKVTKLLDDAVEDEIVLHYSTTDYTVFAKMTSGLTLVWAPQDNFNAENGDEVTMTVLTMIPCYTDTGAENFGTNFIGCELPEGVNFILEMAEVSAQDLRDTLPNYRFPNSQNHKDSAVTLEAIRSFGENQIILWEGHGYYGSMVKSCLVTGEDFDWNAWWWDLEYFGDCVSNRIINSMLVGYDKVIISSGYIAKYCGNMDNSMVYLGTCNSGKSPELANAFTDKGAVVVANSDTIRITYNDFMIYGIIHEMMKINPETGEFYTLEEALTSAKSIYGESDADSRYDIYYNPQTNTTSIGPGENTEAISGKGATPILFGEGAGSYRLMDEVPTGTISGKVAMAADRVTPIAGATIEVYLGDTLFKTITADENGLYELELPFGECTVRISADGYISFVSYTDVRAGMVSYMETFLMVQGDEDMIGVAGGLVVNSLSGGGEADVTLTITKGWNNTDPEATVVLTTTTNYSGYYEVELPFGNYTVIAEKEGYAKSSFNIIVQGGGTWNQDGTITPEINGTDYLITLTWGENPSDVDSHMVGYMENGSYFHVYYGETSAYYDGEQICNLDYDDTTGYGPEHITLNASDAGTYYYYLYKYAGSGTLASSEAKVTIEQGNRVIAEFFIPTDLGSGDYWNIFAIKDGEIIVCNTITYSPDTYYAD